MGNGPLESFNYRGSIEISDRLIKRFGAYGSILHNGKEYPCLIVSTTPSQRERNGTLELTDTERCYMSVTGFSFVPSSYDIITMPSGQKRSLRTVYPRRPAATTVYYELLLEGA